MIVMAQVQKTLIDLTDAYSVILTSEMHTFQGSTVAVNPGSCVTQAIAYQGGLQVKCSIGDIVVPLGMYVLIDDNLMAPTITVSVTSALSTIKDIIIPIIITGTEIIIHKRFSIAIAFSGENGAAGTDGSNGSNGVDGATGVGVSSTAITYQVASSGVVCPTGDWATTVPITSPGQYLWTRTITYYTNATFSTGYSVGKHGSTGADGLGISSTVVTYQASSSGVGSPSGTWLAEIPITSPGQYLWTRTLILYTNGTSKNAYSVARQGIDGIKGEDGANGINGIDGIKGEDGANGINGVDGINGIKGEDGANGIDILAVYTYYKLGITTPSAPTSISVLPPYGWSSVEPGYTSGSTMNLYIIKLTTFADSTFKYTPVSKSSSYEAAKQAYVIAEAQRNIIAQWAYDNDCTYIDGGAIFTKSVSASKIYGGELTMGGGANGNGVISIRDSVSTEKIRIDNEGILVKKQAAYKIVEDDGPTIMLGTSPNMLEDECLESLDKGVYDGSNYDYSINYDSRWMTAGNPRIAMMPGANLIFNNHNVAVTSTDSINTFPASQETYIVPGAEYSLSAFVTPHYKRNSAGASIMAVIKIEIYNKDNQIIKTSTGSMELTNSFVSNPYMVVNMNPEKRIYTSFIAPVGSLRMRITMLSGSSSQWVVFSGIAFTKTALPVAFIRSYRQNIRYMEYSVDKLEQLDDSLCGSIGFFTSPSAPDGYLKCNGALLSRTTYGKLFAVIGTTVGAGDGYSTFQIPDLRGEFIRGVDDGRGKDPGRSFGSGQGGSIQSHRHAQHGSTYMDTDGIYSSFITPSTSGSNWFRTETVGHRPTAYTAFEGSTETRPTNAAWLACIKY